MGDRRVPGSLTMPVSRIIAIKSHDFGVIALSAVRYALGRRMYIVNETCRILRENKEALAENDKRMIVRDIERELALAAPGLLGDRTDHEDWVAIVKELTA